MHHIHSRLISSCIRLRKRAACATPSVLRRDILIFREPAAIVPLAYHLPFAAGLNQFGKPAAKQFLRRLHPLDIVNPHPLIERME